MDIIFSAGVANYNGLSNDQLFQLIQEAAQGQEVEFYERNRPPGIYASSGKWKAVGNVATIVGLIANVVTI